MKKLLTPQEIKQLSLREMIAKTRKDPEPVYTHKNTKCVHSLYYSWAGMLSGNKTFPDSSSMMFNLCAPLWKEDGFLFKSFDNKMNLLQAFFDTQPEVSPLKFTQKVKGRLDHAFRKSGTPVKFSRAVSFRSLGCNTRKAVNNYVLKQVTKEEFADDRYKDFLDNYTQYESNADLSAPVSSLSGRYWYNIHLVIVAADRRMPVTKPEIFEKIKNYIPKIAKKHKCKVAHFAIMPDHIHLSLCGNPELSPYDIALSFMNNLSYHLNVGRCWGDEFYVGSFSEYDLNAIREKNF